MNTPPRDRQWPVTRPSAAETHNYLSTACHHEIEAMSAGDVQRAAELHAYCEADSGKAGAKQPAHCKWCEAPCGCPRHVPGSVPVAWSVGAAETERVLRERYADLVGPGAYRRLREQLGLGDVFDGEVVTARWEMERPPTPYEVLKKAVTQQVNELYRDREAMRREPGQMDEGDA